MIRTGMTADRSGAMRGVVQGFREWRERLRLRRELADLPASEQARLLHDLDLQPAQVGRTIAGVEAPRELLPRMMAQYGLDPATVATESGAVSRDLRRTCSTCPAVRRCRRALRGGADVDECSRFCPNSGILDALARQQAPRN